MTVIFKRPTTNKQNRTRHMETRNKLTRGEGDKGRTKGKGQAKEHRGLMGTDNGGRLAVGVRDGAGERAMGKKVGQL